MAKKLELNQELNAKSTKFIESINSEMFYQSDYSSTAFDFDWVDFIDDAIIYIDNIVRNPKMSLIKEEEVVKIETAKKISVASIKDLLRHTHYIEKVDEVTSDVQPSKILIERSEETFNTYENRLIFTLIYNLGIFVTKKKQELDDIEIKDERVLEYAGSTVTGVERVSIEVKLKANKLPSESKNAVQEKNIQKQIEQMRKKIDKIIIFLKSWQDSEFYRSLEKANVPLIKPPIKRTNLILKNPNFQMALKVWDFLQTYDYFKQEDEDGIDTSGNALLTSILDDAFLMDFFVLDSISISKREQKKRITQYAVIMMQQQIKRAVSYLLSSGIDISDQEILDIISNELKKERNKNIVDSSEIKEKFKKEFDEYLEKTQIIF